MANLADEQRPYFLTDPGGAAGPFVFSSPHSGRDYTPEFRKQSQLDDRALRLSEDCYVDQLFQAAPDMGAALISARFPRAYVDVNREPYELDPAMFADRLPVYANTDSERVRSGLGTIARIVSMGRDIYDHKLVYAEESARINGIHKPYHRALSALLDRAREKHGWAVLIDCHSMPSFPGAYGGATGPSLAPAIWARRRDGEEPDIVLGDRFGTSCNLELTIALESAFRERGYKVSRNVPYAGGYCTVRYGAPSRNLHAIQIEISRRLYMCENTLRKKRSLFDRLQRDLTGIIGGVTRMDLAGRRPLAAE